MKRLGMTVIISLNSMVAMGADQVAVKPPTACQCSCNETSKGKDNTSASKQTEQKPVAQEPNHRHSLHNL